MTHPVRNLRRTARGRLAAIPLALALMVLAGGALGVITPFAATSAGAATATHFTIDVPDSATAGDSFSITVSALDSSNAIDTSYSGSVEFTSSDDNAELPSTTTLTDGTGTFTATFETAGSQTITATDTSDDSIDGTSNSVDVTAADATKLIVEAPSSATAGTAFTVTVTAEDDFGNVDEEYGGTVSFSSSDSSASLPSDSELSDGSSSFSVTLNTTDYQTITATDTSDDDIDGTSDSIWVTAAAVTPVTTATPATPAATPVAAKPAFTG